MSGDEGGLGTGDSPESGRGEELPEVFALYYQLVRRIAQRHFHGEREGHTLQPTALANEAYLRLQKELGASTIERENLLPFAAKHIRQILIDHARSRDAVKRGGGRERVTWVEELSPTTGLPIDLLDLDDALRELEAHNPLLARIVELKFFAGLKDEDVAREFGYARPWANRKWNEARIWLDKKMNGEGSRKET